LLVILLEIIYDSIRIYLRKHRTIVLTSKINQIPILTKLNLLIQVRLCNTYPHKFVIFYLLIFSRMASLTSLNCFRVSTRSENVSSLERDCNKHSSNARSCLTSSGLSGNFSIFAYSMNFIDSILEYPKSGV